MRHLLALAIALLLAQSALAVTDQRGVTLVETDRDSRKRVALVVGNSGYRSSPLKNPANDAHAMADILRRLGFEVEERTDLGYVEMNGAVEAFGRKLRSGGVGLFYYAGHGMQVNGANYLIPVDAQIEDENEVRYKAVDAGLVLAKMEQARSDVNIVVLDACRDNPFSRSFRSAGRGLAFMDAPSGTFIAYATAPGKTAADGEGKNSLFTSELLNVLKIPGIPLEQVFKRANKAVLEKSSKKQSPWVASNLVGEFYFTPPSGMTDLRPSPDPFVPVPAPHSHLGATVEGIEMVSVPGGCFQMGDTLEDGYWKRGDAETPLHEACVSAYAIGKHEVTQGQWKEVMGKNPAFFSSSGDDFPVENVTWDDVQLFIRELNQRIGTSYRLPTEAEWEYAARSGGKRERYSGGDDVDSVAWYSGNCNSTHPVGQKAPNGLGIYDMSGNVWEWVGDRFGVYSNERQQDPAGPSNGTYRVIRGGSWAYGARYVRTARRDHLNPDDHYWYLGFRLVSPAK